MVPIWDLVLTDSRGSVDMKIEPISDEAWDMKSHKDVLIYSQGYPLGQYITASQNIIVIALAVVDHSILCHDDVLYSP